MDEETEMDAMPTERVLSYTVAASEPGEVPAHPELEAVLGEGYRLVDYLATSAPGGSGVCVTVLLRRSRSAGRGRGEAAWCPGVDGSAFIADNED